MYNPAPTVNFTLQVKITVAPSDSEAFLGHLRTITEKVMAEPECAYFFVGENVQEPGVFRLTEGWLKDVAWFMSVQLKKEYYVPYLAATEKMWIAERVAELYSPVEGMGHVQKM